MICMCLGLIPCFCDDVMRISFVAWCNQVGYSEHIGYMYMMVSTLVHSSLRADGSLSFLFI